MHELGARDVPVAGNVLYSLALRKHRDILSAAAVPCSLQRRVLVEIVKHASRVGMIKTVGQESYLLAGAASHFDDHG